jgi:hypothetical protein
MSFLTDLVRFESGGGNVTNVNQSTSSGRARGYFQITDGTWQDFGRRAGVDFAKYPTAQSAPPALQAQVAGMIPLNRWDRRTLAKLTAAGHTFDVTKTLAENAAAHGEQMSAFVPTTLVEKGPFKGSEAGVTLGQQPLTPPDTSSIDQSLAGVFGDALGKVSIGGEGGGSSGGGSLPPGEQFSLPTPSATGPAPTPGAPPELSPLANLFALPTIGQPVPKLNIASKSWT